jgi:hypothetical protein
LFSDPKSCGHGTLDRAEARDVRRARERDRARDPGRHGPPAPAAGRVERRAPVPVRQDAEEGHVEHGRRDEAGRAEEQPEPRRDAPVGRRRRQRLQ